MPWIQAHIRSIEEEANVEGENKGRQMIKSKPRRDQGYQYQERKEKEYKERIKDQRRINKGERKGGTTQEIKTINYKREQK